MRSGDFAIERLGTCERPSPMRAGRFVPDDERILYHQDLRKVREEGDDPAQFELAGPRERIHFDPSKVKAGIVTCGGLCPGLNDVIRSTVRCLHHNYGVAEILGFRYGYEGVAGLHEPLRLGPADVESIHELGGSILGTSRGPQEPKRMVDELVRRGISMLFVVGGDGTLRGAQAIVAEAARRKAAIAVIGVPKTIDNDIAFVETTFGFDTASAEARRAIRCAHAEASSVRNGVGIVKLFGRHSGFIAAFATLASGEVNFCLVPEVPFTAGALLEALAARLASRGHAVIVVAEGAGQELLRGPEATDASGNRRLLDIGGFLRDTIRVHFQARGVDVQVKYIDPSYMIRSLPPGVRDAAFCLLLGQHAVHAAMTGRTGMVVGYWHRQFTHVPFALAVSERKQIDPSSDLWAAVLASTGQAREIR
jgi:6-phosphofructokinase 1